MGFDKAPKTPGGKGGLNRDTPHGEPGQVGSGPDSPNRVWSKPKNPTAYNRRLNNTGIAVVVPTTV